MEHADGMLKPPRLENHPENYGEIMQKLVFDRYSTS
jgi:hypothetical protein